MYCCIHTEPTSHYNSNLLISFLLFTFLHFYTQEVEKGAKPLDPYNYALEILITKSELEEKNGEASLVDRRTEANNFIFDFVDNLIPLFLCTGLIEELKQKVDESKTECAYQLRLKDNQNLEQIKEINKKARAEKDTLGKNINALQQEIGNLTKDNEGKLQKVRMSFKG